MIHIIVFCFFFFFFSGGLFELSLPIPSISISAFHISRSATPMSRASSRAESGGAGRQVVNHPSVGGKHVCCQRALLCVLEIVWNPIPSMISYCNCRHHPIFVEAIGGVSQTCFESVDGRNGCTTWDLFIDLVCNSWIVGIQLQSTPRKSIWTKRTAPW